MIDAIRSEWIKFCSVRSTVLLLLGSGALTIGIGLLAIANKPTRTVYHLADATAGVQLSVVLFGALGVQIIGQEYRFNTIRTTFAAQPDRWRVLAAKLVVVVATTTAVAFAMTLVCLLMAQVFLDPFRFDGTDLRMLWGIPLFAAGWSALGLGVGAILRQPIAGIIVVLVEGLLVEPIIGQLFTGTQRFLPFLNGFQMTARNDNRGDVGFQSVLGGGIYFFVVVAIVLAVGLVLAQRRDA